MKVRNCSLENGNLKIAKKNNVEQKHYHPSFKAGPVDGALVFAGSLMQWIQDQGFLASFLIQDLLGMTAPRVGAAFLRDKEVTGKYNIQEGFEVLGREGLTGPCMMAVAPLMLLGAAKFGKSTSVNSQLIKRYGNSLKEMISKPEFDKQLLKNKDKFKNEFFAKNIREMLENTVGKENTKDESIKYILEQLKNYENIPKDAKLKGLFGKSNYRSECINNIKNHINEIKYNTSSELEILDNVRLGSKELNDIKSFSTKDSLDAMIKYADDAITANKKLEEFNEAAADSIRDKSIAKRFFTNISMMAATLGMLSILPKIYARNAIAPGARTAMELEQKQAETLSKDNQKAKEEASSTNVSFKGKAPNKSWLEKFGKLLREHTNEKFSSELEYNGHNFTNTLMAGLSLFGLLAPRGYRAYERAQIDENGKKDLSELYEILIRDISSSLAVVFAVPMLTRTCVTLYENATGFVLLNKDRSKSKTATALDLLNPYSKAHVLSNTEINSLYGNITNKNKMLNFCEYIDKNNGDLQKIISKSKEAGEIFNEKTFKLEDIAKLPKAEKNKKIIDQIKKLGNDGDELITKVMKGVNKPKGNGILSFAKGLNSAPGVIATFLISPYILGWFIPRLTYANTRRMHENAKKERENNINTAA